MNEQHTCESPDADPRACDGPVNSAALRDTRASIEREATSALNVLLRIQRDIALADKLLRRSQPPILGRLGFRWWKLCSQQEARVPVLVAWTRLRRTGRWRGRRILRAREETFLHGGSADLCLNETHEIVQCGLQLGREYRQLKTTLDSALRSLKNVRTSVKHVAHTETLLVEAHRRVVKKLVGAGYTVDGETMELPKQYLPD